MAQIIKFVSMRTLVVIAILGALNSCHPFCNGGQYDFSGTAIFTPQMDSLRLGDTLWYFSSFSTHPNVVGTSTAVDFSRAENLKSSINFGSFPTSGLYEPAVDSFSFLPQKGIVQTNSNVPHNYKDVIYIEEDSSYELSFGIVLKKRGVYAITPLQVPDAIKKCSKARVTIMSANDDRHTYYIESFYQKQGVSGPTIERDNSYCFKVY